MSEGYADGITVDAASSSITIGGAGVGNSINYYSGNGLSIAGSDVTVLGNGLTYNGSYTDGTGDGVLVDTTASDVTIGGTASGDANTLTANYGNDLEIMGASVTVTDNAIGSVLVDGGTSVTLSGNTLTSLTVSRGSATLSGAAASLDNVTVSGGTLTVAAALTVNDAFNLSSGTTYVNSGETLDFAYEANLTGGTLALQGGTVGASSTLYIDSGATVAGAGTIDGSVDNEGAISLGAPYARGALTITGDYTQESSGSLNVNLDSDSLTAVDQLLIDGAANLAGTLNVTLASGYTPTSGDVFEPLAYGSRSGTFGTINLPSYGGGSLTAYYDHSGYPDSLTLWAS